MPEERPGLSKERLAWRVSERASHHPEWFITNPRKSVNEWPALLRGHITARRRKFGGTIPNIQFPQLPLGIGTLVLYPLYAPCPQPIDTSLDAMDRRFHGDTPRISVFLNSPNSLEDFKGDSDKVRVTGRGEGISRRKPSRGAARGRDGRALARSPTLPRHERRGRKAGLRVNPEQSPAFMPGIRGVYEGLLRPCEGHGGMLLVWARKAAPRRRAQDVDTILTPSTPPGIQEEDVRTASPAEVGKGAGCGGLGAASEPFEGDLDRSREQSPLQRLHSHHG